MILAISRGGCRWLVGIAEAVEQGAGYVRRVDTNALLVVAMREEELRLSVGGEVHRQSGLLGSTRERERERE